MDQLVDVGSPFLQGMFSERASASFSVDHELPGQPGTTGDMIMDNEAPTDND